MGLLANIFGKQEKEEAAQAPLGVVPAGTRVYAVGDVHGRADLLAPLLEAIKADAKGFKGHRVLVSIGDIVDRGPDSAGAVDLLQNMPEGWETIVLRGNHEQALMDFMARPQQTAAWLAWGGVQALQSYGVQPYGATGVRPVEALAAELAHALQERGHTQFYTATRLYHVEGTVLFVHAGVRPGVKLERQMEEDLLMIREDFIGRPHHLPYRVVFGHTIVPQVQAEADRIAIDTGAYQSNRLSAVALEGETLRTFTSTPDGVREGA